MAGAYRVDVHWGIVDGNFYDMHYVVDGGIKYEKSRAGNKLGMVSYGY